MFSMGGVFPCRVIKVESYQTSCRITKNLAIKYSGRVILLLIVVLMGSPEGPGRDLPPARPATSPGYARNSFWGAGSASSLPGQPLSWRNARAESNRKLKRAMDLQPGKGWCHRPDRQAFLALRFLRAKAAEHPYSKYIGVLFAEPTAFECWLHASGRRQSGAPGDCAARVVNHEAKGQGFDWRFHTNTGSLRSCMQPFNQQHLLVLAKPRAPPDQQISRTHARLLAAYI